MNDNKCNYEKIEINNYYYHYTETNIKKIISKDIDEVKNEEWRTLIQMLYPDKMIASGLFQPILIFDIKDNGARKDPPIEAYDSVNELLPKIIEFITSNSDLSFHDSWKSFGGKK